MVLYKLNGGIKVSLIELIGDVPSQRSVFSPLLHCAVEKSHSIQHWLPLYQVANFQKVLVYTCEQYINKGISVFQQEKLKSSHILSLKTYTDIFCISLQ